VKVPPVSARTRKSRPTIDRFLSHKALLEEYLAGLTFSDEPRFANVVGAMRYSLLTGSERLRPVLCMEAASSLGLAPAKVLPSAAAVELIHTLSSIHDELPALGGSVSAWRMPTCCEKYGEATAILAGERVGVANQTTMLMSETMVVGEQLRAAMVERYGKENLKEHFELFDTICSATQDRQDSLFELLEHPLDVVIVVGGYNSSNTNSLALIAREKIPRTYHVSSGECIEGAVIYYKPAGTPLDGREEVREEGWLLEGQVSIGLTAGASTPNSQIGLAIGHIFKARGLSPEVAFF
jgi:(E)-4-hydroxy-3-methyl-but-2-enyl pyrophosphate reductase